MATGESCNLHRVANEKENCSCGLPLKQCSQWTDFFAEFESELVEYERLRSRHESCWGFLLRNTQHQKRLAKYFDFLLEHSGKHVVDSSKTTRLSAYRPFLLAKTHDVKLIHLVKDGRACLASNLRGSNQKLGKNQQDCSYRFAFWKTLNTWPIANLAAEIFGFTHPGNYLRIRFEDFNSNPMETLAEIETFIGANLKQSIQLVANGDEIPLAHQIAGNRMGKQAGVKLRKQTVDRNAYWSPKFLIFSAVNVLGLWRYGYFSKRLK